MEKKYPEYLVLNLPLLTCEVLDFWEKGDVFKKSIAQRDENNPFIFYEGPPSANGLPGIHHVMARTIKDIFCRYKTMKGYRVERKAGWDTHGLPVELEVEKKMGITKDDIGKKISIDEYNKACREDVMKFKDVWEDLTRKMGFWLDLAHPYITYDNNYIETVWYLLSKLYEKGLLYKGYTVQPYSPAAGTGLSSHELNLPGCYKMVKDTTVVAQFKIRPESINQNHKEDQIIVETVFDAIVEKHDCYFLAWTTTPWTLPSNTALAVGKHIEYTVIQSFNQYTNKPIVVILAKNLIEKYFPEKNSILKIEDYKPGDKIIPYKVITELKGLNLEGIRYEQLLPYAKPKDGDAFKVVLGDFVSTEEGTGIVHIAPSFGADDFRMAKQYGLGSLTLVDKEGKFTDEMGEFAGRYVKNYKDDPNWKDADIDIAVKLKKENKAFRIEKYEHTYPHCWRTDKPILYYPLDSWFIRTTACKERMAELNKTINWKPPYTGSGRFQNWLENLQDWNLSRSRFWGVPLPVWRTEDGKEEICIGSVQQLNDEIKKAVNAGIKTRTEINDLHRPYADEIILVSPSGKKMYRETDLIDVWFDSGAMPYAQYHFPYSPIPGPSPKGKGAVSPKYQTARPSSYNLLKQLQQERKEKQTVAEIALWENLRDKQLDGYHFRRQHIIDEFIVDFVCLEKKLVVEVDGKYHDAIEIKEADNLRTHFLQELGYKVIRFTNDEVIANIDGVLLQIKKESGHRPSLPLGEGLGGAFPADFIAEGVDQTRGWFFTLHAIAVMLFDSVAYKAVVSNGLVLDKQGNKMSKRLGNAVDPFKLIEKYGADAVRWYLMNNSQPWDNLKFDEDEITEAQKKFFRALYNTYAFFALYANIDGFTYSEPEALLSERPEIDRWILSKLNTLVRDVTECYDDYQPTKATRLMEDFVVNDLSNWYVRLCRRRFWKGDYSTDKIAAYQTLYRCIAETVKLAAPVVPFFSEKIFCDLNNITHHHACPSVHLSEFPVFEAGETDKELEERHALAQQVTSMAFALRKKANIRVRQPLNKLLIAAKENHVAEKINSVKGIILSEVNVKNLEFTGNTGNLTEKKAKPNFKTLGPKYGKMLKPLGERIAQLTSDEIETVEKGNPLTLAMNGLTIPVTKEDIEISTNELTGWKVLQVHNITVALDITVTTQLKEEGIARELVNRIQNLRKENGFAVTDRIAIRIAGDNNIKDAIMNNLKYICSETLAVSLNMVKELGDDSHVVELGDDLKASIEIKKFNN